MSVRKLFSFAIAALLSVLPVFSFAQQAGNSSVKKAVLKAQDDLVQAEIRGDRDALNRIFTDGFTHTHSTGWVQEKAGFVKSFESGSIYKAFGFSDVVVQVVNSTTAVVTGHVLITTQKSSNQDAFLEVFVLANGAWRCAAWATTPLPKQAQTSSSQ